MVKINKLSGLFAVYKKRLKPPQKVVEDSFKEAVYEVFGKNINIGDVEYKVSTRTIKLHTSSLIKSELKKRQLEIFSILANKLPEKSLPLDIQ